MKMNFIKEIAIRKLYKYRLFIIQTDINNSLLLKIEKLEKKNEDLTNEIMKIRYLKRLPNYL
jgi:hypothetical protein